jgi:hypothetical protein
MALDPNNLALTSILPIDVENAIANSHAHENKPVLDVITEVPATVTSVAAETARAKGVENGLNIRLTDAENDITALETGKQDTLESGVNIKTINNQSLLGSGNISISGGGVGGDVSSVQTAQGAILVNVDNADPANPKIGETSALLSAVGNANSAYQKPNGGIPADDLAVNVIPDVSVFVTNDDVSSAINVAIETHNESETAHIDMRNDISNLDVRITDLSNLGAYVGSFDNKITAQEAGNTTVPSNISEIALAVSVNDFCTVRQDETVLDSGSNPQTTRYVISAIDGSGNITWVYDITYSADLTGKMDLLISHVANNLLSVDANGQAIDSGKSVADFATAAQGAKADAALPRTGGALTGALNIDSSVGGVLIKQAINDMDDGTNAMIIGNSPDGILNIYSPTIMLSGSTEFSGQVLANGLNLRGHKVVSMDTPTDLMDGANKQYVDDQISFATSAFVTGVMTGNGAVNLGWQPSAVFVMASDALSTAQSYFGYSRILNSIALAFPGQPLKSAGITRLTVTATGFTTTGMSGYMSDNAENDMRALLRYIAFR